VKLIILLILFFPLVLTACSGQKHKKKEFEVDQQITDGNGIVNFARAHYIMAKTDAMNRVFEKQLQTHIRKYCEKRKLKKKILRKYTTQTDFVTLRYDYRNNRNVRIYEFQCIP